MRELQIGSTEVANDLRDLPVYSAASAARSIAFLNRLVAISSIVRVILRMLRTALSRLTSNRRLAMDQPNPNWASGRPEAFRKSLTSSINPESQFV